MPQAGSRLTFPIDHVIARQHGGGLSLDNLALAGEYCNRHKGPNIAGIDPHTGQITRLFHPRLDAWDAHFRLEGTLISGLSPVGHTTVTVLGMNHSSQMAVRQALIEEGIWGTDNQG